MEVACYCGASYRHDGPLAVCPACGEPAVVPQLTDRDLEEMQEEVNAITRGERPG